MRPLWLFFVMLFGVSWVGTLPMLLASWRGPASVPPALEPLQLLMLFGPGLVACGVSAWEGGRAGIARLLALLLRWRVGVLWYVLALAGPGLLMLLALGVPRSLAQRTSTGPHRRTFCSNSPASSPCTSS